jgi:glycosyltransferase involved in cell wall biosynthesis
MTPDGYEVARTLRTLLPRRLLRGLYAEPPFFGYLETPVAHASVVTVRGWLFNRGSDIVRLWARCDGGDEVPLECRLPRPDLEFAGETRAAQAGFHGRLPTGGTRLEIWAELSTGRRRLAFATTVRRPLLAPVVNELKKRLLLNKLRGRFEAVLLQAAGDQFPRIAPAEVWDALCRGWMAEGSSWAALQQALEAPLSAPNAPLTAPNAPVSGAAKRRILFVTGMFPSTAHGGGLRLFDIIRHLSARNQVDLYSVYREDLDGASLTRLAPHLSAARLVRSEKLQAGDVEAWLERLGHRPGAYDAVHFEWPQAAPLIAPLRHWGRRSFFTMVECLTLASLIDLDRAKNGDELAQAAVAFVRRQAIERAAIAAAHHTIAVTDVDADFAARAFGGRRPLVVPTCVSDHEIKSGLGLAVAPAPRTALFVGYFDHYPNRDALEWYLAGAHQRISQKLPDYRLRVVGRGNLSHLKLRWTDDPRIDWVGPVDDLVAELQAARIGVAPLVSGAGIRGKINQHAAAGRPCVSTSIGALGLPYRHEESILIADTPLAFADAVARLLEDDALWTRLRDRSKQLVAAHYRWAAALEPLEALHGA